MQEGGYYSLFAKAQDFYQKTDLTSLTLNKLQYVTNRYKNYFCNS